MGTAAFSLVELAWQQARLPALGARKDTTMEPLEVCIPGGDPPG